MRYKRILVKLSGEAFGGGTGDVFDQGALDQMADEIMDVRSLGVEVALMVGGGNIFRGATADRWGIERAEADNIGMMATVVNSLFLRGVLTARGAGEVRVMTATPMTAVAEPYVRLRATHHLDRGYIVVFAGGTGQPYQTTDYPGVQRALEVRAEAFFAAKNGADGIYTADMRKDPTARRYRTVSYDECLSRGLKVMDQSAFLLARDHGLPIHVFDATARGAMRRICLGEDVGTYVAPNVTTELA